MPRTVTPVSECDNSRCDPAARLLGTLVHRLFQRSLGVDVEAEAIAAAVSGVVRPEEWVDVSDREKLTADVAATYLALRSRPDVVAVLQSGTCCYEVPISYAVPDRPGELVRGVIDCIVFNADSTATLVEFKTGAPRPEHETQAALYGRALASVMGVDRVNIRILYP